MVVNLNRLTLGGYQAIATTAVQLVDLPGEMFSFGIHKMKKKHLVSKYIYICI